jgi:hypothetical protein
MVGQWLKVTRTSDSLGSPSIAGAGAGAIQGYHASDGDQDARAEADASPRILTVDSAEVTVQDGTYGQHHKRNQTADGQHRNPVPHSRRCGLARGVVEA